MKPALLLVDLQRDFLAAPGLAPCAGEVVAGAARLLAAFREASWPVLHVHMTVRREPDERMAHWRAADDWRCLAGTAGHEPPPPLAARPGEEVVAKTAFSAFHGTGLEATLRRAEVSRLVLAGVHLHGCVRATALDAYQRGFEVWIAEDAVGDDDHLHGNLTRRYLEGRAARFAAGEAILARLGSATGSSPASACGAADAPLLPAAWLGGRELQGEAAAALPHVSPRAPERILWRSPPADRAAVDAAVAAARSALDGWQHTPGGERAALLERVANRLEAASGELARSLAEEIGKPARYGRAEVAFAVELVRSALRLTGEAGTAPAPAPPANGPTSSSRRLPLGVVALVSPWNNPLAVPLGKLAPALALGNVVVWKPAPAGAARALAVARWLAEAGLPAGALTVVCGGRATAEELLAHPGIDGTTLTGGDAAGATAGALALARGVPLQAELGGNNGAIVWGDADLGEAASAIAEGAFGAAGQRCTANRRAIVDRAVLPAFLERLAEAVAALPWGDPLADATVVGPLVSAAALQRVAAVVERASAAGLGVSMPHLAAGVAPPRPGFHHPPTVVLAEDPGAEVVQEETFGPLLAVQPAASWEQALALLDGVRQGLVAALFSPHPGRRESFLRGARAGVLKLDAATAGVDAALPFGGWKRSGIGPPEHADGDLLAYTRAQAVYGAGGP